MTFKELGVTADRQLVNEIKEAKVDVRDSQEEFKIQRVPKIMVRNEDYLEEYFKPRELSIGPIHSADSSLFKKELKLKLAEYFITETHNTADGLLIFFKAGFKDIKKHFDKDIIMSCTDDELIRLVFLDGCAMLGFIHSYLFQGLNKFHISNRQAELIRQDLLLMENQVPFTVLHALTRYASCVTKYEWLIPQFVHENSIIPKDLLYVILDHKDSLFGKGNGTKRPDHILDLYRRILLTIPHDSHNCFDTLLSFFDSTFRYVFSRLRVLIGYVLACLGVMERFDTPTDDSKYMISRMHSFRNIQELKTAGIKLKPTYSLRRIFFHSRFFIAGQLSIPALVVDDSTERMLLNLVAYEMCLNKEQQATDSWVTSYVNLLDVLIDNEQDVKDLRAAGILQNHLSSDNEVAQLINRVGSNCFAPSKDTYEHVREKIEKHYRRKCAIWMAQVCQSNFSSPWTILALFAATAVLGLTAVQTYYAVNPKN
ncbi:uncharacterized protein LOC21385967 [Morus notabilis]|nr:uncharacterized protein LOC21385967 [Morus notabilis]